MNKYPSYNFDLSKIYKGFGEIRLIENGQPGKLLGAFVNSIVRSGADLLASSLAGVQGRKITHFYFGHSATDTTPGSYSINLANTTDTVKAAYSSGGFGWIKCPLTVFPSFLAETNYSGNKAVFSTIVTDGNPDYISDSGGVVFEDGQYIVEVGLLCQPPTGGDDDILYAQSQLTSGLQYVSGQNLGVSWVTRFNVEP